MDAFVSKYVSILPASLLGDDGSEDVVEDFGDPGSSGLGDRLTVEDTRF